MEGDSRNLEGKASKHEDDAEDDADVHALGGEDACNCREFDAAGEAVNERGAVKQHAGGKSAEDEIFEARFRGARIVAIDGRDDIERQALQLETHIERDEPVRRDHHEHAERRKDDEHGELEAIHLLTADIAE